MAYEPSPGCTGPERAALELLDRYMSLRGHAGGAERMNLLNMAWRDMRWPQPAESRVEHHRKVLEERATEARQAAARPSAAPPAPEAGTEPAPPPPEGPGFAPPHARPVHERVIPADGPRTMPAHRDPSGLRDS